MNLNNLNFNSGDYIPQYAGSPLKEITDTASELSNRHYSNLARLNQLQLIREQTKSKVLPGAKDYIDSQFGDIDQALEEIAKSGGENSTAKVAAIANRFLGDQGVLRANQISEDYNKFLDTQRQLKANGKNPVYNKRLEQEYLNTPVTDPETGGLHSLYNDPFKLTAEPYIEPVPEIDKLWSVIKPDAIEGRLGTPDYLKLSKLLPEVVQNGTIDLPMFYEMIKKSGISKEKIKGFTEAVKRQVESSDLGRQVKDYETLKPEQLDDLILQRGLMKVYSELDRSLVQSNISDDLLKGAGNLPTENVIKNPLPAVVREKFDPGFSTSQISVDGSVKPSLFEYITSGTAIVSPQGLRANAQMKRVEANEATGDTKRMLLAQAEKFEKEADEEEKSLSSRTKERTEKMLPYMKTALEVAGIDVSNMSDEQIKAAAAKPEGKQLLEGYLNNFAGQRYHAPYIDNIASKEARDQFEDFSKGTFSQREFIDVDTGTHYPGLKDENGDVNEDLLALSKAMQDNKVIVEGIVDPKHIVNDLAPVGDNFVRGIRIQVPTDDKGNMKTFLMSQLPKTTSTADINENRLYVAATEVPGKWTKVGRDTEVLAPASDAQKELLWNRYGYQTGLMKEQFFNNDIVFLKIDGKEHLFPNYAKAAQYLAENKGVKLTKQK